MTDRCEPVEPLLSAWADGELDPSPSEAVTRHLARCGDCARVLTDVAAVRDMVRNLPARRAGTELVARTPARARAQPVKLPANVKAFAFAASLLLGAALALGGGTETDVRPANEPTEMFMADFMSDRPGQTFGAPVTTPALLEPGR